MWRHYLSLPEQTSDLHSVQVPPRVHSTVIVANSDLLNHVSYIGKLHTKSSANVLRHYIHIM